jgi:hypothetical protein
MLSARTFPLLAISLILYNGSVFFGGVDVLQKAVDMPMVRGGVWHFTLGDLILLVTILLFFVEIVKATYTGTAAILDHALSMVVFIIAGVQFLLMPEAATSVFFFIVLLALIDVVAGYTIGIRSAKRDINLGGHDG